VKTIMLNPSAAKALDALPLSIRSRHHGGAYAINGTGDTKAMAGSAAVRLRVGDYLVIFDEQQRVYWF
jgi:hypothetical protein